MKMKRRGFTLSEVLVYGFLALVVMAVVTSVFFTAQRTHQAVSTSYNIGPALSVAVEQIRKDLAGAPLASVSVKQDPPGLSFQSSYKLDETSRNVIGDFGVPVWQKWVHYGLDYNPGDTTANLVRWEEAGISRVPGLSSSAPWPPQTTNKRVILRNVAVPNALLDGVGENGRMQLDGWGGFRVQFLRLDANGDWVAGNDNPRGMLEGGQRVSPDQLKGLSRMMEVELKQYMPSSTGRDNYFSLKFRVAPRY